MTDAAALQILICVRAARQLEGAMAEAGVLMGGSARLICEAKGDAELHLFDVFETLQAPAGPATGPLGELVHDHFGSIHGELHGVVKLLGGYPNVHFHPGIFPGTVDADLGKARFSFVHLDMDLPESTRAGLEFFHPLMVPGGIIIGDDYSDALVREVFEVHFRPLAETLIELPWGQVMVVKQG